MAITDDRIKTVIGESVTFAPQPNTDLKVSTNLAPNEDLIKYSNIKLTQTNGKVTNEFVADVGNTNLQIPVTMTGTAVATDMVSPLEHEVECRVESKNLLNTDRTMGSFPPGDTGKESKRVFDFSKYYVALNPTNNYNPNSNLVPVKEVTKDSVTVQCQYVNNGVSFPVKCKPNTDYFMSTKQSVDGLSIVIGFYKADGTYISNKVIRNNGNATFKTPLDSQTLVVHFVPLPKDGPVTFTTNQIEIGMVKTEYIPPVPDLSAVTVSRLGKNIFTVRPDVASSSNVSFTPDVSAGAISITGKTTGASSSAWIGSFQARKGVAYTISVSPELNSDKILLQTSVSKAFGAGHRLETKPGKMTQTASQDEDTVYVYAYVYDTQAELNNFIIRPMVRFASIKDTEFEPINKSEFSVLQDGTVSGMKSISPNMTILTDNPGATIEATYNANGFFGGELDWNSGKLIAKYDQNGNPLDTQYSTQIPNINIHPLNGDNTISSDTGINTVTYIQFLSPEDEFPELDTRMNSYYPQVIQAIEEYQAIIQSELPEIGLVSDKTNNVLENAYLITMNEFRINQWENILGIVPFPGSSLQDRREVIMARIKGQSKLNTTVINNIVKTFTGGTAKSFVKDSILYVEITPPAEDKHFIFENVENEIKRKVPAHLGLNVKRSYFTWGDIYNTYVDWADMQADLPTWEDVYLFVPFQN